MSSHVSGLEGLAGRRTLSSLAAGLVAVPLLLVGSAPAHAGKPQPTPVTHPERDYAGSTIAEHEGGSGRVPAPLADVAGIDVSSHQGSIDWSAVANEAQFAYMKATEGTDYTDDSFSSYYQGSYDAGLIRGAYHFALPDRSSGAEQAKFFVDNGGAWSDDGKTLPPMLDIEYNPYGDTCYGLNADEMTSWIKEFSDEVHNLTGRYPTIYTTKDWWSTCTGDNGDFGSTNPLFVASYNDEVGELPNGWDTYTFWQYTSEGSIGGIDGNVDEDVFNGDTAALEKLAKG